MTALHDDLRAKLPELPKPAYVESCGYDIRGYSADQMRDYAIASLVDKRELIRRLYVELLWCDRQLAGKGFTQGCSVRDVLADSLTYLRGVQ